MLKANHPGLHQLVNQLPWHDVPLGHRSRDASRGRDEIRRIKAATVNRLPFPHAAQGLQIVRRTVRDGKTSIDRAYALTSLDTIHLQAAELAVFVRRHWWIENKEHHVRDVTFREGASRVRTGTPPAPWPASATSPSAPSASTAGPASPKASATTAAAPTGHSPHWVSTDTTPPASNPDITPQRNRSRERRDSADMVPAENAPCPDLSR
ncbi:hypothetical protein [Streptomyces mexicanus]|uniref:hypothetical protein n=1 Tax=Streptomyces mexicanus TaxID=178566 RepID=UPI003647762E